MHAKYVVVDDPRKRQPVEHGVAGLPDPFAEGVTETVLRKAWKAKREKERVREREDERTNAQTQRNATQRSAAHNNETHGNADGVTVLVFLGQSLAVVLGHMVRLRGAPIWFTK